MIPIVVGVGDALNRSTKIKDAVEPKDLIVEAIRQAIQDTNCKSIQALKTNIDSIDVVASWTWPYEDLPGLISEKLKIAPTHLHIPQTHGGNQPAKFLDEAAKRIATGQSKIAVICGGEALASLAACAKLGKLPPPGWTEVRNDITSVFSPTTRQLEIGLGAPHRIGAPIHIYPLYENAFRAHRSQRFLENNHESAELYGTFAKVAEKNQLAWNYGKPAATPEDIGTVTANNRMICWPYPLLMNAFNTVNIAGACILTSTELAKELGVPEQQWIYPLGGAGTRDSYEFWKRPNYYSSPSISRSLDAAMEVSGLTTNNIDFFDFYSCFPIVPKLACAHLDIPITASAKPITLLGGLTSFGGAGNNYSMHALTEMVRRLRSESGKTGLVLANGGVITYQHVVCLSSKPRSDGLGYPLQNPLPEVISDIRIPEVEEMPNGAATIETYTVEFGRDGKPLRGHIIGLLKASGHRFLSNDGDESTLRQLVSMAIEPIGRSGIVSPDPQQKGRNLFFLEESKL